LHQIATEGGATDGKGYSDPTTGATGSNTDSGQGVCTGSAKTATTEKVDLWFGVAVEKEKGEETVASLWDLDAEARKAKCDHALGWREDAGRVVVWFGDAPSHNTTVTREEAINALNARGIVVAGINTGSKNRYMDTCHNLRTGAFGWWSNCGRSGYSKVGDPTAVAEATKGTMNHNVKGDAAVIDAILKGVSAGIAQAGSQAMVSFGVNETTSSVHMYVSKFDSKGWTGDLEAWALNRKSGRPVSKRWSAAAEMDKKGKRTNAYSSFKDDGAHGGFRLDWGNCAKHSACKNDFSTAPTGSSDSDGESRLNWLLGDTSKDGSSLRKRKGLMGDIWHSSPVYVGASGGPWWDGMAYVKKSLSFSKFQKKVEKRKPVVYVGSNGGALHAFDANDGKELFAYYPRSLFNSSTGAGYHHLSEPRFAHKQVYVDGTAVVNDAVIDKQWQTVLVGTLANGGRGIFALNITDPERFTVGGDRFEPYLWEFTNEDDAHFGYSQGKPTIALMNSGDWAVLVGNGPDGTATDEDGGTSQLFILKLSGPGPDGVWDLGRDYARITTGMGETKNRNGGFSPQTVDLNGDGTIDRVYMGDLYSHIWAFDLSSTDPDKWKPAYDDKPLFSGMTEKRDLHTQPITARPLVTRAPRSVTKWIAGSVSAPPATTTKAVSATPTPTPAASRPSISLSFGVDRVAHAVRRSVDSGPTPSGFASTGELTPGKTGDGEPPTIKRATGSISKGGKLVGDGLMIYFGTGRFLSSADKTLMYKQFFYGVHDRGIPDRGTEHLVSQRFIAGGGEGGRITDPEVVVNYSKKSGWYIELPEAGERVIDRAVVRGNLIMFNTLVPDASVCASGGHGWEMSVMNNNGGSPRMASWDFDGDGVIGTGDRAKITTKTGEKKTFGYVGKKIVGKGLPSGSTIFGDRRFTPSSGADAPKETLLVPSAPLPPGRLSWVELQLRN
jgi:Tfp pilus tip-associated adhesin PilY1